MRLFAAIVLWALVTPLGAQQAAGWLVPVARLEGGWQGAPIDPRQFRTPPPLRTYVRFLAPAAVAARGTDIYVADAGLGRVFRYDQALSVLFTIGGVRATPDTRIQVAPDRSAYVLDKGTRTITQVSPLGQPVRTLRDDLNLGQPVDLALDEARGLVLVADSFYNRIAVFRPVGQGAYVISLTDEAGNPLRGVAALAAGRDGIYVVDRLAGQVFVVDTNGGVLRSFGQGALEDPGAIAVDSQGRVFVRERRDNSIKIFVGGQMVHRQPAASGAGSTGLGGLAVDGGWVYSADGTFGVVQQYRLDPPQGW